MATRAPLSVFRLPSGEEVEVVFIRLADGRIVPRRREEVEEATKKGPGTEPPARSTAGR